MAKFATNSTSGLGFDASASPPWLMVGLGKSVTVRLEAGAGLKLSASPSGIVAFQELTAVGFRKIEVTGSKEGSAIIEARSGTLVKAQLDVAVKALKKIRVVFSFVSDDAGNTSNRVHSKVKQILTFTNTIYGPQTNIVFDQVAPLLNQIKVSGLKLKLNDRIPVGTTTTPSTQLLHIFKNAAKGADFNVFFVWDIDQGAGVTIGANCVLSDKATLLNAFGHEAGHFLKVNRHSSGPQDLMAATPAIDGIRIPKDQANVMNP